MQETIPFTISPTVSNGFNVMPLLFLLVSIGFAVFWMVCAWYAMRS